MSDLPHACKHWSTPKPCRSTPLTPTPATPGVHRLHEQVKREQQRGDHDAFVVVGAHNRPQDVARANRDEARRRSRRRSPKPPCRKLRSRRPCCPSLSVSYVFLIKIKKKKNKTTLVPLSFSLKTGATTGGNNHGTGAAVGIGMMIPLSKSLIVVSSKPWEPLYQHQPAALQNPVTNSSSLFCILSANSCIFSFFLLLLIRELDLKPLPGVGHWRQCSNVLWRDGACVVPRVW